MPTWLLVAACTGTPTPIAEPVDLPAARGVRAPVAIPSTPPFSGDSIAEGGLRAADHAPPPIAEGAPPTDPADFQTVSVPLGPREGGGVKWAGVKTKNGGPVVLEGGEVYDPNLPAD